MLSDIARSNEHWEVLVQTRSEALIRAFFQGLLFRNPESDALLFYAGMVSGSDDIARVLIDIGGSNEHWDRMLDVRAPQVVQAMHRGLVNQDPEPEVLAHYAKQLVDSHDLCRLLAEMASSEEHWQRMLDVRAPLLVRIFYRGLLYRDPEPEALARYASELTESHDLGRPLAEIASSEEHWQLLFGLRAPQLVREMYRGLLGRDPEPEALARYASEFAESRDLHRLLAEIASSEEHWQRLFAARVPLLVHVMYRGLFNRDPNAEALARYSGELAELHDIGRPLAEMVCSDELWQRLLGMRAPQMVRAIYRGMLNREPAPEALARYAGQLAEAHDLSRSVAEIASSEEHWQRLFGLRAPLFVYVMYRGLLDRDPEPEALARYTGQLAESQDLARPLTEIAASEEHWQRVLVARAPQLVHEIYQSLLGREPEPEALDVYSQKLSLQNGFQQVLSEIVASQELWDKVHEARAEQLVRLFFLALLSREPERESLVHYSRKIRGSQDAIDVLGEIAGSDEHWLNTLRSRQSELINSVFLNLVKRHTVSTGSGWPVDESRDEQRLASAIRDVVAINPKHAYDNWTLVFLHIKKTAGSSVNDLLRHAYEEKNCCFPPGNGSEIYLLSAGELAAYNVFSGHFSYDDLAYIPRRTLSVFCFVRNPRDRIVSLYNYWRAHEPQHPEYGEGPRLANIYPLYELLADSSFNRHPDIWNHMTWSVMGERKWAQWQREADNRGSHKELLDQARSEVRARLRSMLFVGLQERFAESIDRLMKILGKGRPEVLPSLNSLDEKAGRDPAFKSDYRKPPVSEFDELAISEVTMFDSIVYDEARLLFDEATM